MNLIKKLKVGLASAALVFTGLAASAHTVTFGYLPGAAGSGEVEIWLGSYHHPHENGMNPEGAISLFGVNGNTYGPVSHTFDMTSNTLPTGLVQNVNYFKDPGYSSWTNVIFWQGVGIGGLTPGDYQFTFGSAGTSVVFAPWSTNIGSTFTLTGKDIASSAATVPVPAAMPLLLGALGGLGYLARRRKNRKPA